MSGNDESGEVPRRGGPMTLDGRPIDDSLPEGWGRPERRTGRIGDAPSNGGGGGRSGGIATLFNTGISGNRAPPPPQDDDDDDDDDPRRAEEFFAGGERSGLAVTNPDQPGPGGSNQRDIVQRILQQAKDNGPSQPKEKEKSLFGGSGNRLGSEDDPPAETAQREGSHQSASPPGGPSIATADPASFDALLRGMMGRGAGGPALPLQGVDDEDEGEPQVRHLTFWRNGFSIEDGPLMSYDEPQNKELLEAIQSGRAPPSVFNVRWNQPLQVEVAKRTNEDYQPPPKKPMQAFSGGGNRLGSPTPEVVSSGAATPTMPGGLASSSSHAPAAVPASASAPGAPSTGASTFSVDPSKPSTSIQIRLADGTKMVAKVNLTHTVGDLRSFVAAARPEARPFLLQTTFPSKELSDFDQTVEDAKLQNAVVVQRFT